MDDESTRILKELGLDLERDNVHAVSKRMGLGRGLNFWKQWRQIAALADADDPWTTDAHLLAEPIEAPIPVQLVGDWDSDPLEFSLVLDRPASAAEIERVSAWGDESGREASRDDDDHVSSWSRAESARLPTTGQPLVTWTYDAAQAGPATIRRIIDAITRQVAASDLPVRRLLVGHRDQVG